MLQFCEQAANVANTKGGDLYFSMEKYFVVSSKFLSSLMSIEGHRNIVILGHVGCPKASQLRGAQQPLKDPDLDFQMRKSH